jgi:hypothetical protein
VSPAESGRFLRTELNETNFVDGLTNPVSLLMRSLSLFELRLKNAEGLRADHDCTGHFVPCSLPDQEGRRAIDLRRGSDLHIILDLRFVLPTFGQDRSAVTSSFSKPCRQNGGSPEWCEFALPKVPARSPLLAGESQKEPPATGRGTAGTGAGSERRRW